MLVIAVIIAGVIAFSAELVFRLLFQGGFRWRGGRDSGDRKGPGGAVLLARLLLAGAWVLSLDIRLALSRKRAYLAHPGSGELTTKPPVIIPSPLQHSGRGRV